MEDHGAVREQIPIVKGSRLDVKDETVTEGTERTELCFLVFLVFCAPGGGTENTPLNGGQVRVRTAPWGATVGKFPVRLRLHMDTDGAQSGLTKSPLRFCQTCFCQFYLSSLLMHVS